MDGDGDVDAADAAGLGAEGEGAGGDGAVTVRELCRNTIACLFLENTVEGPWLLLAGDVAPHPTAPWPEIEDEERALVAAAKVVQRTGRGMVGRRKAKWQRIETQVEKDQLAAERARRAEEERLTKERREEEERRRKEEEARLAKEAEAAAEVSRWGVGRRANLWSKLNFTFIYVLLLHVAPARVCRASGTHAAARWCCGAVVLSYCTGACRFLQLA